MVMHTPPADLQTLACTPPPADLQTLFYPVLPCFTLFYPVLPCFTLFRPGAGQKTWESNPGHVLLLTSPWGANTNILGLCSNY